MPSGICTTGTRVRALSPGLELQGRSRKLRAIGSGLAARAALRQRGSQHVCQQPTRESRGLIRAVERASQR